MYASCAAQVRLPLDEYYLWYLIPSGHYYSQLLQLRALKRLRTKADKREVQSDTIPWKPSGDTRNPRPISATPLAFCLSGHRHPMLKGVHTSRSARSSVVKHGQMWSDQASTVDSRSGARVQICPGPWRCEEMVETCEDALSPTEAQLVSWTHFRPWNEDHLSAVQYLLTSPLGTARCHNSERCILCVGQGGIPTLHPQCYR